MKIFDSHAHYDDEQFNEDRYEILSAMPKNNVAYILNAGCDYASSLDSIEMSKKYDFIYADPPYDLDLLPTIPDLIFEQGLLKEGGYFVLEHSKTHDFYQHPHFIEQRTYGSVHFTFFK